MERQMSNINKAFFSEEISGSVYTGQNVQQLFKKEYAAHLTERKIKYSSFAPYLIIGDLPVEDGWLIHISVVRQQMDKLLSQVLDLLAQSKFPFVIPADSDQHSIILDGRSGLMNVGKIISVYIRGNEQANLIASNLIKLTEGFKGPAIPEAVSLGSCVYVSYGRLLSIPDLNDNKFYSSLYGYNAADALRKNLAIHHIKWPFNPLIPLKKKRISRLTNYQYLLIQPLKNDPKGNVLKCIKLNKCYDMQWCVLKQGNQYQCFDEAGRDIKDRLLWQYHIHKFLEGKVSLPQVIEYFEVNADAYLAFEYIEGISLNEKIMNLHQGSIWQALDVEIRREIICYLLQVIEILDAFHRNGLVHRDVTPGNFLITEAGKVVAIDIELCYNFFLEKPEPPFILGTQGYMSPQQIKKSKPVVEDDIYGLGGLFVKVFTGLSPYKLTTGTHGRLYKDLIYFFGSDPIVTMICACLRHESQLRPGIKFIKQSLEVYDASLLTVTGNKINTTINSDKFDEINLTVQKALNAFSLDIMLGANKEWVSKTQTVDLLANEMLNYCWCPGFNCGTAGILFTLSLAQQLGYQIEDHAGIIYQTFNYFKKAIESFKNSQSGLSQGSYGMAISIDSLIRSELIENGLYNVNLIYELLSLPTNAINIADGIAGQGLSMLYCMDQPRFPSFSEQLSDIASALIDQQEKDGSWLLKKDAIAPNGIKLTGFYCGVAGIIYFLLEYSLRFENQEVIKAINKSLNWLIKQRKFTNGNFLWSLNPKNPTIDPWLEYGFSGIALTFIKAFEVLKDPIYKEIATSVLLNHPKYISSNYLTLGNGLSGLGEIYLEAFKIFKEIEWKERAEHIADYLIHSCKLNSMDTLYWLEGNNTKPTVDLMTGVSGIIHFLMRYNYPEKIGFPFLLNNN
jgi:serine/threonine protein kinase